MTNAAAGATGTTFITSTSTRRDFTIDITVMSGWWKPVSPAPAAAENWRSKRDRIGRYLNSALSTASAGGDILDESGKARPIIMGCYGIGVTRTMAAAIEQNNDRDGIIWPAAIAPFHAVVVPVNIKDPEQAALAENIYERLTAAGVETLLDDRPERAGVKFKDADLIGYPLRITVGSKAVSEKTFEVKARRTGEVTMVPDDKLEQTVLEMLRVL
jgi:prolyl-tRNA synthetase